MSEWRTCPTCGLQGPAPPGGSYCIRHESGIQAALRATRAEMIEGQEPSVIQDIYRAHVERHNATREYRTFDSGAFIAALKKLAPNILRTDNFCQLCGKFILAEQRKIGKIGGKWYCREHMELAVELVEKGEVQ